MLKELLGYVYEILYFYGDVFEDSFRIFIDDK
jgi:hypothetical protein